MEPNSNLLINSIHMSIYQWIDRRNMESADHWVKSINLLRVNSYEDRLIKLKLPSLEFRRLRGDMIEVFKISNNKYDAQTTNTFFEFCENMTRNNGKKLTKNQVNFKPFQYFFTNRIINVWNSLPGDIVNSDSVNGFKNSFDNLFASHLYKTKLNIVKNNVTTDCPLNHRELKD